MLKHQLMPLRLPVPLLVPLLCLCMRLCPIRSWLSSPLAVIERTNDTTPQCKKNPPKTRVAWT